MDEKLAEAMAVVLREGLDIRRVFTLGDDYGSHEMVVEAGLFSADNCWCVLWWEEKPHGSAKIYRDGFNQENFYRTPREAADRLMALSPADLDALPQIPASPQPFDLDVDTL